MREVIQLVDVLSAVGGANDSTTLDVEEFDELHIHAYTSGTTVVLTVIEILESGGQAGIANVTLGAGIDTWIHLGRGGAGSVALDSAHAVHYSAGGVPRSIRVQTSAVGGVATYLRLIGTKFDED